MKGESGRETIGARMGPSFPSIKMPAPTKPARLSSAAHRPPVVSTIDDMGDLPLAITTARRARLPRPPSTAKSFSPTSDLGPRVSMQNSVDGACLRAKRGKREGCPTGNHQGTRSHCGASEARGQPARRVCAPDQWPSAVAPGLTSSRALAKAGRSIIRLPQIDSPNGRRACGARRRRRNTSSPARNWSWPIRRAAVDCGEPPASARPLRW